MRRVRIEILLSEPEQAALDILIERGVFPPSLTEAAQRMLSLEIQRRCRETDLGAAVLKRMYGQGPGKDPA